MTKKIIQKICDLLKNNSDQTRIDVIPNTALTLSFISVIVATESANNQIFQQDETLVAILACSLVVIVYIALNTLYQGFCNKL